MKDKPISNTKLVLLIILFLIIIMILYARFVSTKGLRIKEYPVYNENIIDKYDGLKIVHFSDVLYGRTVNKKDVHKLVTRINELKPDIVIFTGDLVDKEIIVKEKVTNYLSEELNKIDSRLGKFAIYGDYDYRLDNYEVLMKNAGFTVLNNSYELVFDNSTTPLFIGGLASSLKGKPDSTTALSYLSEHEEETFYKIVLMHEPDNINSIKDYNVDLVLSGHSLNGQINLPFVGALYTYKGSRKFFANYYRIDKTDFYISSGIGTTKYSFRWFNKPSINMYRLYKK